MAFKSREAAMQACMAEFGITRATALKWYKQAEAQILAQSELSHEKWVSKTLHQLSVTIEETEGHNRLAAIAQRTALLGLNAPTRVHVTHEMVYQRPDQFQALRDPVLRAAALELEAMYTRVRANGDHQGNGSGNQGSPPSAASVNAGTVGLSRVRIPGPPPSAPTDGNGDNVRPE